MLYLEKLNKFIESKFSTSNWFKKQYIWRYSLYFRFFYMLLIIGLIYTIAIKFLISEVSYNNQSCSSWNMSQIQMIYTTLIIIIIILIFCNFVYSRLTNIYSHFTNSEFVNLGIYYVFIGFLLKYVPWVLSLIYMIGILFISINIVTFILSPTKWCSEKYNVHGADAVNNCLLYMNDSTGCAIPQGLIDIKKNRHCNDFNILKKHNFLFVTRKNKYDTCSLEDKALCQFFVEFLKDKNKQWDSQPQCLGNSITHDKDYFLENSGMKSNIYLFTFCLFAFWVVTIVVSFTHFIIVRASTPVDPSFVVNEDNFNIIYKFTRLLDVWR
ncbi:conserved membrane protein, unknown function [Hepatocystis sp. ex Piliocolobus tephrosceles]|nr:conserved membrane protein, unknown function [Hepatocystis sp. ex Piliocolobus tephrosceles]